MLSIFNSERFQNELNNYRKQIDSVSNDLIKNQLNNFLNKLIIEVKNFDKDHEQMIFSKSFRNGSPNRDNLTEIRKTLDRKLADWKRSTSAR